MTCSTSQHPEATSAAFCPLHVSGDCGSCPHQHLPTDQQRLALQQRVVNLLAQEAGVPVTVWCDPVPSPPYRFRNKAKMVVSGSVKAPILGIMRSDSRAVDLRTCPLHVREIEAALPIVARTITHLQLTPYNVAKRRGELKHVLLTASPDGDLMIRWVMRSRHHIEDLRRYLPQLRRSLPTLAVMSVNIQPIHQAIIEGEEEIILTEDSGGDRLLMRLTLPNGRDLPLTLPTRSFFQTNTEVACRLYATAAQWIDDDGHTAPATGAEDSHRHEPIHIWDLFCGVGGFALAVAGPGRIVRGVEVSAAAIEGARESARLMGLTDDVSFEAADARVLDPGAARVPDVLIVNPPRRGIGEDLARRIDAAGVPRVLYSSCNPASLARDLRALSSYEVTRAQAFDMFPHTDHGEVLVDVRRRAA